MEEIRVLVARIWNQVTNFGTGSSDQLQITKLQLVYFLTNGADIFELICTQKVARGQAIR